MKTTYEPPMFSMSECRVPDDFLLSAGTTTTTIQYDDVNGWSPIKPPRT